MSQRSEAGVRVARPDEMRVFFHEAVTSALSRQRVAVRGETEMYLVNLLVEFLSPEQLFERQEDGKLEAEPLAFMLKRAVEAAPAERARHLKRMGDTALYVSGFFSDSLSRGLVDVDYYAAMGGRAYDVLGGMRPSGPAAVFRELAEQFLRLADVLADISERAAMTSNAGLLRLYERYVRTGSERLRRLLEDKGVAPVSVPLTHQ